MVKNYFTVERSGKVIDSVVINDKDGNLAFEDVMNMSYDELRSYEDIDMFITCVMDMTNEYFNESDDQTIVTLIGEDGVFIWSIMIGPGEEDDFRYAFVDWYKDGHKYRYAVD